MVDSNTLKLTGKLTLVSHHLGLESNNLFVLVRKTCLAATIPVTEFHGFHLMLNFDSFPYRVIFVDLPNEMISSMSSK
jgi:hypothetical protein